MERKIELTEDELYSIISRCMAQCYRDAWSSPDEFHKIIINEYYARLGRKTANADASSNKS
jgi:hypothetical protein